MNQTLYALLVSSLLASPLAEAQSQSEAPLTATIIGSGSPIYNPERAQAGILITQGYTQILVDMGEGVRDNLYKLGVDDRKFDALMFTHHHVDHNAEFTPMLVRSVMGRKAVKIYGPTNTVKFTETLLDLYKQDLEYRLAKSNRSLEKRTKRIEAKDLKSDDSFTIGDINVSTLEVPHTIETFAYRFDYQQQSIVITGDLTYTDEIGPFAKGADCLIIDSGGVKMERKGAKNNKRSASASKTSNSNKAKRKKNSDNAHLNLADSALIAKQAQTKNMVYVHFGKGKIDEKATLSEVRKQFAGKVTFSEDLMQLDCGD